MNETQSRQNTASATYGLSNAPSGGTAMPMNTKAASARVPWRPSQASARTGASMVFCRAEAMRLLCGTRTAGAKPAPANPPLIRRALDLDPADHVDQAVGHDRVAVMVDRHVAHDVAAARNGPALKRV